MPPTPRASWQRPGRRPAGGLSGLPPVVRALLVANVAIFLADRVLFDGWLGGFGAFTVRSAVFHGRLWEFITFQFLHANLLHLAFNMIGLYVFGPWVERWLGSFRFAVYYLVCGAAGALCYAVVALAGMLKDFSLDEGLVGASAGIYAIFVAVAMLAPHARVMLVFPPVDLSIRQAALLMLGIAVLMVFTNLNGNAGGEAGHLGGALAGFILMRHPALLGWLPPQAAVPPPVRPTPDTGSEVDRILEKISAHGFHSLTRSEIATLNRARQQLP